MIHDSLEAIIEILLIISFLTFFILPFIFSSQIETWMWETGKWEDGNAETLCNGRLLMTPSPSFNCLSRQVVWAILKHRINLDICLSLHFKLRNNRPTQIWHVCETIIEFSYQEQRKGCLCHTLFASMLHIIMYILWRYIRLFNNRIFRLCDVEEIKNQLFDFYVAFPKKLTSLFCFQKLSG